MIELTEQWESCENPPEIAEGHKRCSEDIKIRLTTGEIVKGFYAHDDALFRANYLSGWWDIHGDKIPDEMVVEWRYCL